MNSLAIAATFATITFAAVPKYFSERDGSMLADDCEYMTEVEYKKYDDDKENKVSEAAYEKCKKACGGLNEDATAEEKKAAMEAGIKKLAAMAEKCKEPADKTAECMKKEAKAAQACIPNCFFCANYDSASTLVLGAAAVATAMLLI
jgi:hypothetical protein